MLIYLTKTINYLLKNYLNLASDLVHSTKILLICVAAMNNVIHTNELTRGNFNIC